MKLNHDCVRDLLLFIEEKSDYNTGIDPYEIELGYDHIEVLYAADKLLEADYVKGIKKNVISADLPQIIIKSITWEGHLFLDNIRDDTVWDKTKKIAKNFSSMSLSLIGKIASQVIVQMVSSQL